LLSLASIHPTLNPHSFPTRRSSDLSGDDTLQKVSPMKIRAALLIVVAALVLAVALPSTAQARSCGRVAGTKIVTHGGLSCKTARDRKSTRLNSSHQIISYAVFCLKK